MSWSWMSFPFTAVVPDQVGSGNAVVRLGTMRVEAAGVANRRKGTGFEWTAEQRATLMAIPGAAETENMPADWRNPEPP